MPVRERPNTKQDGGHVRGHNQSARGKRRGGPRRSCAWRRELQPALIRARIALTRHVGARGASSSGKHDSGDAAATPSYTQVRVSLSLKHIAQ